MVRGDFAELARLRQQLKAGATGELKTRLLKAAAAEARTQVQLGFREQVDPSGTAWAPLLHREGMILRKTARMANSFTATPTGTGFSVGTNVKYAEFHQNGSRGRRSKSGRASRGTGAGLPKRQMVPEGQLTPRWSQAIDAAVSVAFRKFFSSK